MCSYPWLQVGCSREADKQVLLVLIAVLMSQIVGISSPYKRTHFDHGTCYYLASYDVHQTWWCFGWRERNASRGIRKVKAQGFVSIQKAQGFVGIQKVKGFAGIQKVKDFVGIQKVKAQVFAGIQKMTAQGFVGILKVKARGFVGARKMKARFVDHGIEQLETAGIRELHSVVADKKWKTVAVAGPAKYALVPRIGVGLEQGMKHCMV